jgi:hypothetical protein
MPLVHSNLGASAAHRWVRCPASVQMCEGRTQPDSPHALEGTCAHELAERALRAGNDCEHHVGLGSSDAPGYTFTQEMATTPRSTWTMFGPWAASSTSSGASATSTSPRAGSARRMRSWWPATRSTSWT